jgi:hypothetical protein
MKYVGILSVVAISVAGFAYFVLFAGPSLPEAKNSVTSGTEAVGAVSVTPAKPEAREAFAGAGSLNNLFARGQSMECQITYIPNPLEEALVGSFFAAKGKVRADYLVPTPDLSGQMLSSVIFDGDTLYAWSEIEGDAYGFKISDTSFAATSETEASPIPTDVEIQYDCLTWSAVDYTIFEPPTNVLFTDMSDVVKEFESGTIYLDPEVEL